MKYFIVDAFTEELFKGNQAGVCLLNEWIEDEIMQKIASENNLAETAFVVKRDNYYDLRWFTPEVEIDLCGHATLASAFVISNFCDKNIVNMDFHTMSGVLSVKKIDDLYEMDFPARKPNPISIIPLMEQAIGIPIKEAYLSRDMLLVVDTEKQVQNLKPDLSLISKLHDCFALIVTAKGEEVDFVSRFFAPNAGIPEDPVTGSSHSTLIPFWAERLGKNEMVAKQLSNRGGMIYCQDCGDRVKIAGKASLYLQGEIMENYMKCEIDFSTVTACGECCVNCSKKTEGLCEGCIESDGHCREWAQSGQCPIYKCAIKHGVQFCGLCEKFPCGDLPKKIHWNPNIVQDLTNLALAYHSKLES